MSETAYEVVLRTSDGVESTVPCPPGTTVLDAAAAEGLILPSLCGQGTCGACEATVTSGTTEMGPHDPALLGRRAAGGAVLLCSARPTSPCTVDLPYDRTRVLTSRPVPRPATVREVEVVAEATFRLVLQLGPDQHGGTAAEFDPGQYVQLQLPGSPERRAYSIANCGNWDGLVELLIRFHPGGHVSSWLADGCRVGDEVVVHGPSGAFGLVEGGLRPRWFVAGGTGLAPMLSMVRRMAEWGDPQPVRLFFGVNRVAEVFGTGWFDDLAGGLLGGFAWTIAVADGSGAADGYAAGTVVDALVSALADLPEAAERPDVYVCGPPGMVVAVEDAAHAAGVPDDQVFVEHFTAT